MNAVYSKTHPDYIHYIYLIAPISLCILNPIAFILLEANEKIKSIKELTTGNESMRAKLNKSDTDYHDEEHPKDLEPKEPESEREFENVDLEEDDDADVDDDADKKRLISRIQASLKGKKTLAMQEANSTAIEQPVTASNSPNTSGSLESSFVNQQQPSTSNTLASSQVTSSPSSGMSMTRQVSTSVNFSNKEILKATLWSTIQNPIVFMTFVGIIANFILKQHIPALVKPILDVLADSFSALALFYLGFTMVGKINNLRLSSILVILILIFTKNILFPLITREAVLHVQNYRELPANATQAQIDALKNETESLSTFGFLYGTFPTAPSLFFYISQYKHINSDLVSAALVFGTLASAPLMMVSGKMIALQFNNTQVDNFEDIECKTAYGFGLLTWFSCLWVIYIFLASGRLLSRPHRYTFYFIISQMANALVHILWTHLAPNAPSSANHPMPPSALPGYLHVIFGLFTSYLTRCWPLAIMLNIISIYCDLRVRGNQSVIQVASNRNSTNSNNSPANCPARCRVQLAGFFHTSFLNRFILNYLARSRFMSVFVGLLVPVFTTALCVATSASLPPQGMMIALGKPQMIISIVLLAFVTTATVYLVFMFIRFKNVQDNLSEQRKRSRNEARHRPAANTRSSSSSSTEYGPLRYGIDGNTSVELGNELAAPSSGMKQESEKQNLLDQSDDEEAHNEEDSRRVNRRRRNVAKKSSPKAKSSFASARPNSSTNDNDGKSVSRSKSSDFERKGFLNWAHTFQAVERNTEADQAPVTSTNESDKQYQLMQHLALVVVMAFNSLMVIRTCPYIEISK